MTESNLQFRPEINLTKNPKFDYFIGLKNYLLKSEDHIIRNLALSNVSVIYQMLGYKENIKVIENLKENEIKGIDEKIAEVKFRNINYFKIRKLNTIQKYKSILNIMRR
jgi:hypothetical protein